MEGMHGQTDLIDLDKYIADCVKNETNEDFSIVINIHKNELYYDNLMNWLHVRGYKWYSGNRLLGLGSERYDRDAIAISIYPKEGYIMFYSLLNENTDIDTEYVLDYEDIDFESDDKSNGKPETSTADFGSTQQKQLIVYISGAISGTTDYLERFEKAETELKSEGYTVINPAKINSFLPNTTTWEQYMEIDYKMLDICDAIYMLDGWVYSKGAKAEYEYAVEHHMSVMYQNANDSWIVDTTDGRYLKLGFDIEENEYYIGDHYFSVQDAEKVYKWLWKMLYRDIVKDTENDF